MATFVGTSNMKFLNYFITNNDKKESKSEVENYDL